MENWIYQMKNIAFFVPSISDGGAERVAVTLCNKLSDHFHVHILSFSTGNCSYGNNCRHFVSSSYEQHINYIKKNDISVIVDIFHWNENHYKFWNMLYDINIPYIIWEHNSFFFPHFVQDYRSSNDLDIILLRNDYYQKAFSVVLLNQTYKNIFSIYLDNATYIHNSPDPKFMQSPSASYNKNTIIAVGNFKRKLKNFPGLLRIFSQVRKQNANLTLKVLGQYDQEYLDMVNADADFSLEGVEFAGMQEDLIPFYQEACCFITPSHVEGMPMVILEASAMGVPSIAYDIFGMRAVVKHDETGYLVPYEDEELFTKRILELTSSEELRDKLGETARKFMEEEFNLEGIVLQWVELISKGICHGT